MKNEETQLQPVLSHVEPVLPVKDVAETILYWQDVLGFPAKWTWGEPPVHGGVSWNGVFIQFSCNPRLASVSEGHSIWIRVQRLQTLYEFHQKRNANIVAPLENKPWGMAEYALREINGYFLHFAAPSLDKKERTEIFPGNIRIIERLPNAKEYLNLMSAVGWSLSGNEARAELALAAVVFAVVAEDTTTNEVIGCALLLGDRAGFYYVKDVMVRPDWQGKGVGTAMMRKLTGWLESNIAYDSLVALITGERLEPFYQQFGFAQVFAMQRYIQPWKKDK